MKAVLVGAPRSGAGKTTIALGLCVALRRRGLVVRAAKVGPDYIDPAFHQAATAAPCFNLDSWAMPPDAITRLLSHGTKGADVAVIEGAMGLFDGVPAAPGRTGASADIAALFGIPVLLVLDISGQAQTAAAVARGFVGHAPGVRIEGVILNRVGSERHREAVTGAMASAGIAVLGAVPRDQAVTLPERHLGLVQAAEHPELARYLERLADLAERCLDLDTILALAGSLPVAAQSETLPPPPAASVAVARDAAFGFLYPHLLEEWRVAGAVIRFFSPLADEPPQADCALCWLPGGYPELHAGRLAAAARFRAGLRRFAETGGAVHGECGGYMVLGEGLIDADGGRHRMAGLLGHVTSFAERRLSLGYRRCVLLRDCALGPAGRALLGHEFHYATVEDAGDAPKLARVSDGRGADLGEAGGVRGRVSGTFFHLLAEASA